MVGGQGFSGVAGKYGCFVVLQGLKNDLVTASGAAKLQGREQTS